MTTTNTITFLSVLTSHQQSVSQSGYNCQTLSFPKSSFSKLIPLSSSSSSSVIEEPESSTIEDPDVLPPTRGGCEICGREEPEKGCNGEGRIQGGIATVPGFGWWPIKAYRPCPGLLVSGGRYRRRGQSMDEVAFGRGKKGVSMGTNDGAKSSKKKQGPRRFQT
ncbi:Period circadian protein like [Actinidia chinensis var. chinensis]|uniref:Period circadian protein like n=1 Tax=Actinidia chinensis var. chinensis TaxID=1590841 RepID=A0A2R6QMZ0_ACTCC|nr:Period circadian protein like [Actinidia chinensis var. chinensis]